VKDSVDVTNRLRWELVSEQEPGAFRIHHPDAHREALRISEVLPEIRPAIGPFADAAVKDAIPLDVAQMRELAMVDPVCGATANSQYATLRVHEQVAFVGSRGSLRKARPGEEVAWIAGGKFGEPLETTLLTHAEDLSPAGCPDGPVRRNVMDKIEVRFSPGYLDRGHSPLND